MKPLRSILALAGLAALAANPVLAAVESAPAPEAGRSQKQVQSKDPSTTDQADQIITNRMLRASTGSLSNWSVSTSWVYSAGSINAPFSATRPNITSASDTAALQSLSGTIGTKYRIDAQNSVSLSTGLYIPTPFHNSIDTTDPAIQNQFDNNRSTTINDPLLSFTRLYKFRGIQNIVSWDNSLLTSDFLRAAGYRFSSGLWNQMMYEVPNSKLSLGMRLSLTKYFFDDSSPELLGGQANWVVGAYPALEYVLNDRFNLRTVSGIWVREFRRDGEASQRIIYQSVGLGISVARNFFLYPNVQFIPGDLRTDRTNLGVNANINLF